MTVRELATGREYQESRRAGAVRELSSTGPLLPGIDLPGIHVLRRIGDMDVIKAEFDAALNAANPPVRRAPVVIGAGYTGLEMAENLRHRGAAVDVVEMVDQISSPPRPRDLGAGGTTPGRSRGVGLHLSTRLHHLRESVAA